jgi:hypothetical protein
MKTKVIVAVVSAAAFMAAPAMAGAQNVKVYNAAGIPGWRIAQFERAAGQVANSYLRDHWGSRAVQWSQRRGWPLLLERSASFTRRYCGAGAAACHFVLDDGTPAAIVDANRADYRKPWTVSASHELFEMMVDPHLARTSPHPGGGYWLDEVADPVEDDTGWVWGVRLADFVYPAWYDNTTGPQDAMGWLDDSNAGTGVSEFSCPTGYAHYDNPDTGPTDMGPAIDGGCSAAMRLHRPGRLRVGQGARRDHTVAIGRPLKLRLLQQPAQRRL